jgi:hypothetical protein
MASTKNFMPEEFVKCDNDVCSWDEEQEMMKEGRQEDKEPQAHMLTSQEQGGGGRRQ